jgi:hypothetical protein
MDPKVQIDSHPKIVGDFITPLSSIGLQTNDQEKTLNFTI